jgi:hypothetical protein
VVHSPFDPPEFKGLVQDRIVVIFLGKSDRLAMRGQVKHAPESTAGLREEPSPSGTHDAESRNGEPGKPDADY